MTCDCTKVCLKGGCCVSNVGCVQGINATACAAMHPNPGTWCGPSPPGPGPSPPGPGPTPPGPSPSKGLPIGALIGIIVGGCMILGIIIALILHKKKNK